jgi:hypothetical protein
MVMVCGSTINIAYSLLLIYLMVVMDSLLLRCASRMVIPIASRLDYLHRRVLPVLLRYGEKRTRRA